MTTTTDQLYNIVYHNHFTHHMGILPGGEGITHEDATRRARHWCVFASANAPRGVVYTLGEWTLDSDQWGAFDQAEVWTGPECIGLFVIREVTK
jgi:hypothetical protein